MFMPHPHEVVYHMSISGIPKYLQSFRCGIPQMINSLEVVYPMNEGGIS